MFNDYVINNQIDSISDKRKKEIESIVDSFIQEKEKKAGEKIKFSLPVEKEDGNFELPTLNL